MLIKWTWKNVLIGIAAAAGVGACMGFMGSRENTQPLVGGVALLAVYIFGDKSVYLAKNNPTIPRLWVDTWLDRAFARLTKRN